MLTDKKKNKYTFWSFFFLFLFEAIYSLHNLDIPVKSDNFFFLFYFSIGSLLALYTKTSWKQDIPRQGLIAFYMLMLSNLIAMAWGLYTATGYLDFKNTLIQGTGGLGLLIPFAMMTGINFLYSQRFLKLCIYIFLASFITIPLALKYFNEFYPRHVVMVVLFIPLIPWYRNKERIIILLVAIAAVAIALSWRANVLRIGFSFLILSLYYFREWITRSMLTILQVILFIIPFYYLYQGINGNSVFEKNTGDAEVNIQSNGEEENLAADTRTQMYSEVLSDLNTSGKLWLGKGSNGKYKTEQEVDPEYGDERVFVEVGFLKILLTTGVLGMILYTSVLILAVFYGTWRTNNILTKMMAMFLTFHWFMLFLENTVEYSMYFFVSWVAVGICFSKNIRSLNDKQIKEWFRTTVNLK